MQHIPKLADPGELIRMGETTLAEGIGTPLSFGRAYMTLMVCVAGCARMSLDFTDHAVRPGDVLVIADDTVASLGRRSRAFRMRFFLLSRELSAEVAYPLPNALFLFLHRNPRCTPEPADRPLLESWLLQMRHAGLRRTPHRRAVLRNLLQNFFLEIAGRLPDVLDPAAGLGRKQRLAWRFWELVGTQCTRHRDVQHYARMLNITPFYLSQLTGEFFSESPKALIDRQVTLEIKALLSYSDLSVAQIADRLNFADPSYLCRYFRR